MDKKFLIGLKKLKEFDSKDSAIIKDIVENNYNAKQHINKFEEIIRKENKKNINVRNRGYDFRITCSEEMPTEIDEKVDIIDNVRDKFRISYQLSYYRVDLTISKDEKSNDYGYEVEI